jgi:hypothetical protein
MRNITVTEGFAALLWTRTNSTRVPPRSSCEFAPLLSGTHFSGAHVASRPMPAPAAQMGLQHVAAVQPAAARGGARADRHGGPGHGRRGGPRRPDGAGARAARRRAPRRQVRAPFRPPRRRRSHRPVARPFHRLRRPCGPFAGELPRHAASIFLQLSVQLIDRQPLQSVIDPSLSCARVPHG